MRYAKAEHSAIEFHPALIVLDFLVVDMRNLLPSSREQRDLEGHLVTPRCSIVETISGINGPLRRLQAV